MRTLALCLLAALSLSFAPAPLPRRDRNSGGDDLAKLQGDWTRVSFNGQPVGANLVVVKGDVWRANQPSDSWTMKLDQTKRPKHIDLIHATSKTGGSFRGVYKLEGDTFTYSVGNNVSEENRPRDFETTRPGAWVAVHKRVNKP